MPEGKAMTKSTKGSTKPQKMRSGRTKPKVPKKGHWNQPAGYHIDGVKIATLGDLVDPSIPTMSLAELTEEQRVKLVVTRLQIVPDDFRIAMIGPGVIDKTRAIAEVQSGSRIGRTLMEIELNLLMHLGETSRRAK
jgi:hypothetical protein